LIGFVLPAINLNIDFLGNSHSMNFSVSTLFSRPESRFGGSELSQADLFNLSDNNMFQDMFAEISPKLITSVGAYFVTLILLIVITVFTFINKFTKSTNIMITLSFVLFAYAGYTILSLMETLYNGLESSLGFLALFLNISDLLKINLGHGYWITLVAIGSILLIKIFIYIHSRFFSPRIIQST
jgi:succinate-acetate transporter protein